MICARGRLVSAILATVVTLVSATPGRTDGTSDNIHSGPARPGALPTEVRLPDTGRSLFTADEVGAAYDVEGQRIRQIMREMRRAGQEVGEKIGAQWFFSVDDVLRLHKYRLEEKTKVRHAKADPYHEFTTNALYAFGSRVGEIEALAERILARLREIETRLGDIHEHERRLLALEQTQTVLRNLLEYRKGTDT